MEAAALTCVYWAEILVFAFELTTIDEGIPTTVPGLCAATAALKQKLYKGIAIDEKLII